VNPEPAPQVVVGVDGSASSTRALDLAIAEAATRGWPLHVVHVSRRPSHRDDVLLTARAHVEDTAHHLSLQCSSVPGSPADVLARTAGPHGVVVVGRRGLGAVGSLLLGSTSAALVANAPCPVYVVSPGDRADAGRVVLGVAEDTAPAVAAFAFDEAARLGAELVALHAWESSVPLREAMTRSPAEVRQERMAREQAVLEEALSPLRSLHPDVPVRGVTSTQDPVDLLRTWSTRADLVVVGRGSLGRRFAPEVDSTAYAVLHRSGCPVVVVPTPVPQPGARPLAAATTSGEDADRP
jgi:nucleotide-binding universal stress UspA family protein